MLAADQSTKILPVSLSTALRPIHRSTISVHHAKQGYDYPMIRLPHTLSKLIGLPTKIYQTIYDGALAFLVVVAPPREAPKMSTKLLSLHGEGRAFESPRAHRFFDSEAHTLSFKAHFFSHRSSYFFILALRVRIHHAHSIRRAALKATSRMRRRTTAFTAFIIHSHFNRASWFVCS